MAKELPFFKFEISEWMFGRIQKQPAEVQGNFINLCCKYWHKLGEYAYEDACLDFGNTFIDNLILNKLIGVEVGNGSYIFIKFLDIQLDECEQSSNKQRIKGLKSAAVRAIRRQQNSTVVQPLLTVVQPNPTEEKRREEKRKEESENKRTQFTFGTHHDTKYFLIVPKTINSPTYRINGEDGMTELFELNQSVIKNKSAINTFLLNNSGKHFNEFSHVYNTFNIHIDQNTQAYGR